MTHPQDSEQQADIHECMVGLGFIPFNGGWSNHQLFFTEEQAAFIASTSQAQVAEARANERKIVEAEVVNEYRLTREAKALTPDGLNGYWSALRDIQLNNKDRIAQLNPQKPKQEDGDAKPN